MTEISNHPLWHRAEHEFLRAECLLQRAIEQMDAQVVAHDQERGRVGLEAERALAPIQNLAAALLGIIQEMAEERQDNRIQRWQGQLQELLTPVEEAELQLQELLLHLEQPAGQTWQGESLASMRPMVQRRQLQQLLAQRQRQVQQLQAELQDLRRQCWILQDAASQGAVDTEPPRSEPAPARPSIFGQ